VFAHGLGACPVQRYNERRANRSNRRMDCRNAYDTIAGEGSSAGDIAQAQ
jgi:hypothetical protein